MILQHEKLLEHSVHGRGSGSPKGRLSASSSNSDAARGEVGEGGLEKV